MRRLTMLAFSLIFGCLVFASVASAQLNSQVVRESDNGTTITVSKGTQIDLLLDENTMVVQEWKFNQVTGNAVSFKSEDHVEGDAVRPDGTFVAIYEGVFHADNAGTSTIMLTSTPSTGSQPTPIFKVTIIVK
jgi:predicted secreted protein